MKAGTMWAVAAIATTVAVGAAAMTSGPREPAEAPIPVQTAVASAPEVKVFKSPTCGCCSKWVDHMRASGFTVVAHDTSDMAAIKQTWGVPEALHSCHTAIVGGYVIEGHVPAADIKRLLEEKPKVAGLAVPGMVTGSPGMEGDRSDPYDVIAYSEGKQEVFAKH